MFVKIIGDSWVVQVGIIHTSYRELSRRNAGLVMAGISHVFNALLCAIHCHKVPASCHPSLENLTPCECVDVTSWVVLSSSRKQTSRTGVAQCCKRCVMWQVIKLSDTVQPFPRSVTACVHGAAPSFLEAGAAKSKIHSGEHLDKLPLLPKRRCMAVAQQTVTK